jgi:hypothetical protein
MQRLAPLPTGTTDAIVVENDLAYLLESLGNELITVAEQLRSTSPFVAIEGQTKGVHVALSKALIAGRFIKSDEPGAALTIIRQVLNGDDPDNKEFTRRMDAWAGNTGSLCPNCGHEIGDLKECSNCFHSLRG